MSLPILGKQGINELPEQTIDFILLQVKMLFQVRGMSHCVLPQLGNSWSNLKFLPYSNVRVSVQESAQKRCP